jgi:outer membrane protein OmpA-like peptidoglycan-associated protein
VSSSNHAAENKNGGLPASVERVLSSPGTALQAESRNFLGSKFGHDFSQVRVHADTEAASSAKAMGASAYTVGQHVVFGAGKYEPASTQGQQLLAHELTHTIQQGQSTKSGQPLSVVGPGDASEKEADRAAAGVAKNERVSVQSQRPLSVQRQPDPAKLPHLDLAASASPFMASSIGSVTVDNFKTGKADVSAANQLQLGKTAENIKTLLRKYPGSTISVIGHTDAIGLEASNQGLGQERADAVRNGLVSMGIPDAALHTESHGATDLLVKTKKADGRNRRVEVRFHTGRSFPHIMNSGLSLNLDPPPDLTPGSTDFCKTSPNLCPSPPPGQGPGAKVPPQALQPGKSTIPYHLMDVPSINEPFISHGNKPDIGGDLRSTWMQMYLKYRYQWGLSEELAAKAANSELKGTAGAAQSRDYPNALDRSDTDMKRAYPDSTKIGPINIFEKRF